jgi:hypothetical protein
MATTEQDSEMNWQPIETAPREDDLCILAWCPDAHGYIVVAWQSDDLVKGGGWFGLEDYTLVHPTHWMPLPEPPND